MSKMKIRYFCLIISSEYPYKIIFNKMQEFIVKKEDAGQTAVKFIKRILNNASEGFIYKQIRKKNIVLNDKKCTGKEKVSSGDSIKIYMTDDTINTFSGLKDEPLDVSEYLNAYKAFINFKEHILSENEDYLFINKPVGMLSQKDEKNSFSINEACIGYLLSEGKISADSLKRFKPSICNRLDRNTGGIITFGKTVAGANILNAMFKERSVKKYYLTIVKGEIKSDSEISGFLYKDEKSNRVYVSNKKETDDYKEIKTAYKPLKYNKDKDITLLSVHLITGKTHQIRAHLSYMGHPIIGDVKYGGAFPGEKHQFLYAERLEFPETYDEFLNKKVIECKTESINKYF